MSAAAVDGPPLSSLTAAALLAHARKFGTDAATQLAHDAVVSSPMHKPFIDAVAANLAGGASPPKDMTLAIVPGLLYREFPKTGADGRRFIDILHTLGLRTVTVPIRSAGTLEENARIIADFLANSRETNLTLLSFSKGSADIKVALRNPALAPAFAKVRSWISVGGILNGTPLIGWLNRHRFRRGLVKLWFRMHRLLYANIEALDHGPGTPLEGPLQLPAHLRLIHLITFPRAADITMPLARRAYRRLEPLGPNDAGGLLLGDLATFPGFIYPIARTDHYLRTCPTLPDILRALLAA